TMEIELRELVIDRAVIASAYAIFETGNSSALSDYLESWANQSLHSAYSKDTATRVIEKTLRFAQMNVLTVVAIHSITDVLFNGWEMDNYAWAIDLDDASKLALTSDYGCVTELSHRELTNKIAETSASLNGLIHLKTRIYDTQS
ncbi:MAG: hypothetical protein JHC38_07945, partial [Thiotrichales bacterium]|nr:hypothetical protein [Thiotrichales bacterium]